MTPQEVQEKCRALGMNIQPTTLQNYRNWGLVTPPVTKTLGRGKGRSTDYDPIAPGEIYAAQRLMKSDLNFSTAQIKRFRALYCRLPNPDEPWPPDLLVRAGALLWGLMRSLANHGTGAVDGLEFHVYGAEELDTVWKILRQEDPRLCLTEEPDVPREGLMGIVIVRRQDDRPGLSALLYPDGYEILAYPDGTEEKLQ